MSDSVSSTSGSSSTIRIRSSMARQGCLDRSAAGDAELGRGSWERARTRRRSAAAHHGEGGLTEHPCPSRKVVVLPGTGANLVLGNAPEDAAVRGTRPVPERGKWGYGACCSHARI